MAASNRDLDQAVLAGQFRDDLLFRLNVVELILPPLRERKDRVELAEHLLAFFARQLGKKVDGFTAEARQAILRYTWPGNLRELRNAVERATIFAKDRFIGVSDLPGRVARVGLADVEGDVTPTEIGQAVTLEQLEAQHIRLVLERSPSLDEAAHMLGIDPSTLYRKRKQLGL